MWTMTESSETKRLTFPTTEEAVRELRAGDEVLVGDETLRVA